MKKALILSLFLLFSFMQLAYAQNSPMSKECGKALKEGLDTSHILMSCKNQWVGPNPVYLYHQGIAHYYGNILDIKKDTEKAKKYFLLAYELGDDKAGGKLKQFWPRDTKDITIKKEAIASPNVNTISHSNKKKGTIGRKDLYSDQTRQKAKQIINDHMTVNDIIISKSYYELIAPAGHGHVDSQYKIGLLFGIGSENIEQNLSESKAWLEKASYNKHIESQSLVASILLNASDKNQDNNVGIKWAAKAADSGDIRSQALLSIVYSGEHKYKKKENIESAVFWAKKVKAADPLYEIKGHGTVTEFFIRIEEKYEKKKQFDVFKQAAQIIIIILLIFLLIKFVVQMHGDMSHNVSNIIIDKKNTKKLYSPYQILFSSLFFGPIVPVYFLTKNFNSLSKTTHAKITIFLGIAYVILFGLIMRIIKIDAIAFYTEIAGSFLIFYLATKFQMTRKEILQSTEYSFRSNWVVILESICWLILTLTLAYLALLFTGHI